MDFCEELAGVWAWDTNVPFPDIIEYLSSYENDKSKNLKLAYIASNFYQYNTSYGLNDERKAVVKNLYENKRPINNQRDLDMALNHVKVFVNDEYFVEEAIHNSEYGIRYKLQYSNDTHGGLGRPLTYEELRKPDFTSEDGYEFEAKMCWETVASIYPGKATLDYSIDPDPNKFDETAFLEAFNKLEQAKALHKAPLCFCLVKKSTTFGYLVGIKCPNGKGISAKLLGPLEVNFLRPKQKFI
jgi:hypothetical protein